MHRTATCQSAGSTLASKAAPKPVAAVQGVIGSLGSCKARRGRAHSCRFVNDFVCVNNRGSRIASIGWSNAVATGLDKSERINGSKAIASLSSCCTESQSRRGRSGQFVRQNA